MTAATDLSTTERDVLERRAHAWLFDYKLALDTAIDDPSFTLDRWIELAWEKGLLAHVSPADQELRDLRASLGKTLWRPRRDPVLYWRVQYAMEYCCRSLRHTGIDSPHATAVIELIVAIGKLGRERQYVLFPKLKHHSSWSWEAALCKLLRARAQKALRDLGVAPHDPTLTQRSVGVFQGIECSIDRILGDGTVWLNPTTAGEKNANLSRLFDLLNGECKTDGQGFCPSLLDDSSFTLAKGKR